MKKIIIEKIFLYIILTLMITFVVYSIFYRPNKMMNIEDELVNKKCYVMSKVTESSRDPLAATYVKCRDGDVIKFEDSTFVNEIKTDTTYYFIVDKIIDPKEDYYLFIDMK